MHAKMSNGDYKFAKCLEMIGTSLYIQDIKLLPKNQTELEWHQQYKYTTRMYK